MSMNMTYDDMGEGEEVASVPMNVGCLETLLKAAQQQQVRQLKRFLQLKKQAEHAMDVQRAWEEKEALEEERRRRREEEVASSNEERAHHNAEVAARRAEAQNAAAEAAQGSRQRIMLKIEEAERRAGLIAAEKAEEAALKRVQDAGKAAARQEAYDRSLAVLEQRRQQLQEKLDTVEERLRERDEIKGIQEKIRKEEQFLRELKRREAAMRAATEEAASRQAFQHKAALKDELLQRRQQESEAERKARAHEWEQHWAAIQQRVEVATQESEAKRNELRSRLEEKMQRAELLAEQKERLVQEMAALRRHMGQQEAAMKQLLERAARGDTRLLQSVDLGQLGLAGLEGLDSPRGRSSRPVSAGASPRTTTYSAASPRATSSPRATYNAASPRISSSPRATYSSVEARPASASRQQRPQSAKASKISTSGAPHLLPSATSPPSSPIKASYPIGGVELHLGPQEKQLLQILEEELQKEALREATLAKVSDEKELQRLLKLYSLQRELARQKILALQGCPAQQPATC